MKTHSLRGSALRLRVPLSISASGDFPLPPEVTTYVTRVHRVGLGGRFMVFDPERAVEADAEIVEVSKGGAVVRIESIRPASIRPDRQVTLIQCVGKGEKMEAIVRDATELGATRIIPATAERTIVKPDAARAERWRRIAVEAARQCGRGDAPTVDPPSNLLTVLSKFTLGEGEAAYCLDPNAKAALGPALSALPGGARVTLLVGPEGGFEPSELIAAERARFAHVSLGPLILRTETVCAAVLGAILVSSPRARG